VIDELAKLESERTIRLLDVLFIARDTESEEAVVLDHPGTENLGAIVGALLGIGVRRRARVAGRRREARSTPSDSRERASRRWPPALVRASRPAYS
jgi:hypothetical protein